MKLENRFTVAKPQDEAWQALMQIEEIAPCFPGARLTGQDEDGAYLGQVDVRLGPLGLTFAGRARFVERDDAGKTARVLGDGKDTNGRGGAQAEVTFALVASDADPAMSDVTVNTEVDLAGSIAQYGRASGLIQSVANQLVDDFARNLNAKLSESTATQSTAATPAPTAPVSVFSILWRALKARLGLGRAV